MTQLLLPGKSGPTPHPGGLPYRLLPLVFLALLAACARPAEAPGGPPGGPEAGKPAPGGFITASAWGLGEEPKRGGIAVIAHRADPPSAWDPMVAGTITLGHVSTPMNGDGNLLKPCRDDVNKVCPGLAESWEANRDATEYTFKVREGVQWHDGQPFTVEDAKFWLDLVHFGYKAGDKSRGPSPRLKPDAGAVRQVEILPGNRIKLTLEAPDLLFPALMAHIGASNLSGTIAHPKHLFEPELQKGNTQVAPQDVGFVGLGPFKMLKYEKGSVIQLRRFDGYWEKDEKGRQFPFLDGIDYPLISDPTAMDAAFRTGRLDGQGRGSGFYLTRERLDAIKNAMADKVWFGRIQGALWGVKFNALRPSSVQDVRVRRAISLWLDKQAAVEAMTGGDCCGLAHPGNDPLSGWVNPDWKSWPGFNPTTRERDRAEAKRLLQEAGYSGPSVLHMCRREWLFSCEQVQSELTNLGLNPRLDIVDDADWRRRDTSGDFDIQTTPPGFGFNVAVGPERLEGHLGRASTHPLSTLKHEDPKIEDFFRRLRAAQGSLDQRVQVWREMERYLVLEQAYGVPTWGEWAVTAYRTHLKGLWIPAHQRALNLDFAMVWLDK